MAITDSEFKDFIEILLKNKENEMKKSESAIANMYLSACTKFISDGYDNLLEEIQSLAYTTSTHADLAIKEKIQAWNENTNKLIEFCPSKLLACLDSFWAKYLKNELIKKQEIISDTITLVEKIQNVISADSELNTEWKKAVSDEEKKFRHKFFELFMNNYQTNSKTIKELKVSQEELLTKSLKITPKWTSLILKQFHELDLRFIYTLYFELLNYSSFDRIEKFIDSLLQGIANCRTATPSTVISNLSFTILNLHFLKSPAAIDHMESLLQALFNLDLDAAEEKDYKYGPFDFSQSLSPLMQGLVHKESFTIVETYINLYGKCPKLYWQFKRYGIKDVKNTNPEFISKLFDLFEIISPADVFELMTPIIQNSISFHPLRINYLVTALTWMRDSITIDSSLANKEKMSEFAHRLLALIWDNPELADTVLAVSVEQYETLYKLLKINYSFDELTMESFKKLFEEDRSHSIETIHSHFEEILTKNISLQPTFHFWLNMILKMHDDSFDKSKEMKLKSKIEKLPTHYLQVLCHMLKVTHGLPVCVEQFFAFAFAFPFTETLTRYLNSLIDISPENMVDVMIMLNELSADNPEFLAEYLSKTKSLTSFKTLKELHQPLFTALMSKHSDLISPEIINTIFEENQVHNLFALKNLEEISEINLVSIFLNNEESLKSLRTPLLNTLIHNLEFALQFSSVLSTSSKKIPAILNLLNEMLMTSAKIVLDLFKIISCAPKTLLKILEAATEKSSLFVPDISSTNKSQILYHLLMDFYHLHQADNPQLISTILWLLENSEETLARTFLRLHTDEKIKPHIPKLLSLAKSQFLSEVKIFLEALETTPDSDFQQKLLLLASEKNSSLVSYCLTLDPVKDKYFYDYILNTPVKIIYPKLSKLIALHACGKKELLQRNLMDDEIKTTIEEIKSSPISNLKSLENLVLSFMPATDIKSLDKKELTSTQRTKLTLGISKALISSEGYLQIDLIDLIKETPVYKKLKSPLFKEYLDHVLEMLKKFSEFSERLQEQSAPEPFSRGELLIETMLGLPSHQPVTAMHAKLVTLATLLCPIRQDSVGSCFSTSIVIQASSYPEGLLQIFEDYISLVSTSRVQRATIGATKTIIDYPLLFNVDQFISRFKNDNLLSRAYEYIAATMSESESTIKHATSDRFSRILESYFLDSYTESKEHLTIDKYKLATSIQRTLRSHFNDMCLQFYSGDEENIQTETQGAWLLLDRDSFHYLNNTENQLIFFNKLFKKSKETLLKDFPLHEAVLVELFDEQFKIYVQSEKFKKDFFKDANGNKINTTETGLPRINHSRFSFFSNKTPMAEYGGGHTEKVIAKYYEKSVTDTCFPYHHNPFVSFEVLTNILGENENDTLENNPCGLITVTSSHGFNLHLGMIKQIIQKGAETITRKLRITTEELANMPLTEKLSKELIDAYISYQDYPNKEIGRLHKKLLLKNSYNCLAELCREIIRSDNELMGKHRKKVEVALDWAIRSAPSLQDKLPPVYNIADTNWEGTRWVGLSCRISDRSMHYVFSDTAGKLKRVCPSHWSPGSFPNWTLHRHSGGTDDLSRTYLRTIRR